jgi:uncharacterized protein YkwD
MLALVGGPDALAEDGANPWSAWSASPIAIDLTTLEPMERDALALCGAGDAGLRDTARAIVERKLRGRPGPELDEIARIQRAVGEPHPWARAWIGSGRALDDESIMARLESWLGLGAKPRLRRCGVAIARSHGSSAMVVVATDALADLAPIPTRVRPGQWITVEARLRVPATGGHVIVLGPANSPLLLPTSFDGWMLRARFAPDQPGKFALQVVADVAGGPRPVIEATVFAGVEPPWDEDPRSAPGEDQDDANQSDDERLAEMISAARRSLGLPLLVRDWRLDAVARDHAGRMARAHELAHEVGDGDPVERLRAAGVDARHVGENVAHAATLPLAHRSLWASPSHRANLLRREFRRVGVSVVHDERGDVWLVEAFAGS